MADQAPSDLTALTVELVSAFVANNNLRSEDLGGLIATTHSALSALNTPAPSGQDTPGEDYKAAVTARKSLADPGLIISMIDGKPYKTLKRHLSARGLDPESYRARYKLASDYPTVAPGYSEARRETAKRLGLGRKAAPPAPATPAEPEVADKPARKPRARKSGAPS